MASTLERPRDSSEQRHEGGWSQIPPRPAPPAPNRLLGLALRALGGAAVAALLWGLGHRTLALVLVGVLAVVGTAAALVPAVGRALDRVFHAVEHGAGRAITFVVLGLIELLVFAPAALVLWVLRIDPLARGSSPRDPTFWQPKPTRRRGSPLYRRQFAYERPTGIGARRRSPAGRIVTALGVVVVLLAADLAVGAAIDGVNSWREGDSGPKLSALAVPDVAASRNEPWSQQLGNEISYTWDHKAYDPNLGWKMPDFDGQYVHVKDRVRRSYLPPGSDSPKAITIYFFGGSTMWGTFQRDEHTIPSEIARLAQADGIIVKPVNYGSQAYVNWQETMLLSELASGGSRPDVAVFYDGANDLITQGFLGPYTQPTNMEASVLRDRFNGVGVEHRSLWSQVFDEWANTSAVARGWRQVRSLFTEEKPTPLGLVNPWKPDQSPTAAAERGRDAVQVVRAGTEVAQGVAERYGFQTLFVWQPTIYTKGVVPGEENVPGAWGENQDAWKIMSTVARSELKAPMVDMTMALSGVRQPIMYDFHHTNELGAAVMARAIYARLKPQLVALAAKKAQ